MKEIDKEIRASLMGIIKNREKAMKAGEAANDDLLGILMETSFREIEEHGNNKNVGFSMNDVIEECKLFYFAGQETTSVLLNWTMVLLSKHQDWQERARQEVLQVFGNNKPNYDGLNHLKIVSTKEIVFDIDQFDHINLSCVCMYVTGPDDTLRGTQALSACNCA